MHAARSPGYLHTACSLHSKHTCMCMQACMSGEWVSEACSAHLFSHGHLPPCYTLSIRLGGGSWDWNAITHVSTLKWSMQLILISYCMQIMCIMCGIWPVLGGCSCAYYLVLVQLWPTLYWCTISSCEHATQLMTICFEHTCTSIYHGHQYIFQTL